MFRLISFITLFIALNLVQTAQSYEFFTNCTGSPNYTRNSPYQNNLRDLLSNLTSQSYFSGFYTTSLGLSPNQVFGLYLCRGDMNGQSCSECVYKAHNNIFQQCPSQIWAVIWFDNGFDHCMLRYSNAPILGRMNAAPSIVTWNPVNITSNETRVFIDALNKTMNDLSNQVSRNAMKYGVKEASITKSQKLYTLGQCTPDLTPNDCDRCLQIAIKQLNHNFLGGTTLQPSCIVKFEVNHFYSNMANLSFFLPTTSNSMNTLNENHNSRATIAIKVAIPIIITMLITLTAIFYLRKKRNTQASKELEEISSVESLQYDFRMIREATDNFSLDNKLGEGGFGAVYKGKLLNGQEIAVKRLSVTSGQGIREFKTEVQLVAKLQHKNLVKLLGFSLHEKEKLLVYELMPNASLDKVLLDHNNQHYLNWETRYKIIGGIARGLLYLHEDSRLKIIHRDLKSSNILLDKDMEPKISDFGLARLVGADQSQVDTNRIVGTYGYMSPEYAMTGRFSVKSDVYSFGVIVLETLSGHKCNSTSFPYNEESLLERTWRLWNNNVRLELVDTRLGEEYSSEEIQRCIHIALLCVQEDASRRPTMAPIVSALSGHPVALTAPSHPQFVTATSSSNQTSSTFSGTKDITEVYPR